MNQTIAPGEPKDPPRFRAAPAWRLIASRLLFSAIWPHRPRWHCPVCGYRGPFKNKHTRRYRHRRYSYKCPCCGANERARLQYLALRQALGERRLHSALHIAPEPVIARFLRSISDTYVSADLLRTDTDCQFDIQAIPFADQSLDLVYASHVLVYARDDHQAIAEIHRVLRPGGLAVLPMPILHTRTRDPQGRRFFHEPGLDYFDRYRARFREVQLVRSGNFPERFQLYDRIRYLTDTPEDPRARALEVQPGVYEDIVPLCFR